MSLADQIDAIDRAIMDASAAAYQAIDREAIRNDRVRDLEAAMLAMPDHQIDIPVTHRFATGLYCREIVIPAGATVVGKLHAETHVLVVSGCCVLVSGDVETVVEGHATYITPAGTKRAIHALTDTVMTTIHTNPDNGTDVAAIEARVLTPEQPLLDGQEAPPCLS
jgi:quercetin dioxygenase-like cupin family protein